MLEAPLPIMTLEETPDAMAVDSLKNLYYAKGRFVYLNHQEKPLLDWARGEARADRIACSPDGKTIAVFSARALRILEAGSGAMLAETRAILGDATVQMHFSPDSQRFLAGTVFNGWYLWDRASGKDIRFTALPDARRIFWNDDGQTFLLSTGNQIGCMRVQGEDVRTVWTQPLKPGFHRMIRRGGLVWVVNVLAEKTDFFDIQTGEWQGEQACRWKHLRDRTGHISIVEAGDRNILMLDAKGISWLNGTEFEYQMDGGADLVAAIPYRPEIAVCQGTEILLLEAP